MSDAGWTDSDLLACVLAEHPAFRSGAELDSIDPAVLTAGERIDLLTVLEQQRRWFEAAQLRVLAAIQNRDTSKLGLGQESVSLALQLPSRTAQGKLMQAKTLVRELPRTLAAVSDGWLSAAHAHVLAEAVWRMSDDPALPAALEEAVLPPLQGRCVTVPQLRRRVRRAAMALDPVTAEVRHQRAVADRCVRYTPDEDGMASLSVYLAAPDAQSIYTRLTAATTLLPPADRRTLDQQRADLFVDAMLSGLAADELPRLRGRRPEISVVVSADTLLGLDDQPGQLAGYGPITATTARRLAAEESGTWRRLLTDPDTGAAGHRPAPLPATPTAARLRRRPGRQLRVPDCNQPGHRCEYDHIVPYAMGGPTNRQNGALACRRHNQAKAGTGWSYRHNADGSFTWTTSTGHRYTGSPGRPWPPRWNGHAASDDPPPY